MLRLSFDATSLCQPKITGVGVYSSSLAKALMQTEGVNFQPYYRVSRWKKAHYIKQHLGINAKPLFSELPFLSIGNTQIFHGPDFRVPVGGRFKKVVTVHDLVVFQDFYDSPSGEKARNNFRKLVQHCQPDHYITVSNFIKNELEHLFPETKGKVSVTYSGIDHLQVIERKGSEIPLFIYIGTIEERKNLLSLTNAFQTVLEIHPEAKLILAGGKGLGAEHILEEVSNCRANKAITYEGFITNERRAELLSLATGFVYPSLYEGFGLPILEAMLAGCPVITANTGACAEVSHNMAWEVEVTNPDSIAKAMLSVIEQPSVASEKAAKAKIYSQSFTWERCAKETVGVYEKVLNSK